MNAKQKEAGRLVLGAVLLLFGMLLILIVVVVWLTNPAASDQGMGQYIFITGIGLTIRGGAVIAGNLADEETEEGKEDES